MNAGVITSQTVHHTNSLSYRGPSTSCPECGQDYISGMSRFESGNVLPILVGNPIIEREENEERIV